MIHLQFDTRNSRYQLLQLEAHGPVRLVKLGYITDDIFTPTTNQVLVDDVAFVRVTDTYGEVTRKSPDEFITWLTHDMHIGSNPLRSSQWVDIDGYNEGPRFFPEHGPGWAVTRILRIALPSWTPQDPTAIPMHLDPERQIMRGVTRIGGIPFEVPYVTKIEDNLWQGGCADGLHLPKEITAVLSLYPWESYVDRAGVFTADFKMHDSLDQRLSTTELVELADIVNKWRRQGQIVLVHCQAGLNRSALITALALIREGATAEAAIATLREKRSPAVLSNPVFEDWLRNYSNE